MESSRDVSARRCERKHSVQDHVFFLVTLLTRVWKVKSSPHPLHEAWLSSGLMVKPAKFAGSVCPLVGLRAKGLENSIRI